MIDKAALHGCVRLTNSDAEELAKMVAKGVIVGFGVTSWVSLPVWVTEYPGPYRQAIRVLSMHLVWRRYFSDSVSTELVALPLSRQEAA